MAPHTLSSAFTMKARTGAIVLSFLVILGMLLAACGGTATQQQQTGPKNSVLTIVPSPIGDFTKNFNPFAANPSYGSLGMIHETLLFFNQIDGKNQPWLASSYKVSDDAKSITFTLRQNVKWSDGQPFTSDDVLFTLNLLKNNSALDLNSIWQSMQDVSAPDANTVVVTLKKPDAPSLWYIGGRTYIVPKHIWATAGDPVKFTDPNPVGTGPYVLKSFTPQLIALKKNSTYWQPGKPEIAELHYPSFNSNTAAELLLSRSEVDWTGLFTPNIDKTFVSKNPTNNHYWFPPTNVVMLYVNLAKPPFNSLAVRQAMSMIIDREQINKVAESGYEPVAHPTGLVLPSNQSSMSTDYSGMNFSVDKAKAAQLLEGAGFTKGADGIYAKAGQKLSFNLNVVTGWTDWVTACQIMANNFKDLGMDVKVNSISFNAYYSALQLGTFDTAISWTNPGPTPYYLYKSLLHSANTAPLGKAANSNWERWNDPATDTFLNQYASSTDTTVQQQALTGLQKVMVEQLPSIPLVYGATWYEYSTARFTGWPDAKNAYAMPSPYTFPDAEVVVLNLKSK